MKNRIKAILNRPEMSCCTSCENTYVALQEHWERICPLCGHTIYESYEERENFDEEILTQDEIRKLI